MATMRNVVAGFGRLFTSKTAAVPAAELTFVTRSVGLNGRSQLSKVSFATGAAALGLAALTTMEYSTCSSATSSSEARVKSICPADVEEGAAGGGGAAGGDKGDDAVDKLIDRVGAQLGDVGFGAVVGFSSGYALKKVGKAAAVGIGLIFVTAQALSYYGVIDVKWKKVGEKAKNMMDADKDGKVDKEDVKIFWRRLKDALTKNLPAGGGFSGGFVAGMYSG